jgi:hypothetical protein
MRNAITGYWSKALGFGFTELVASELIGQVGSSTAAKTFTSVRRMGRRRDRRNRELVHPWRSQR